MEKTMYSSLCRERETPTKKETWEKRKRKFEEVTEKKKEHE